MEKKIIGNESCDYTSSVKITNQQVLQKEIELKTLQEVQMAFNIQNNPTKTVVYLGICERIKQLTKQK